MRHSTALSVASLASVLLFTLHVADDMVRGIDSVRPQSALGVVLITTWLYAALFGAERRAGLVILLLGAAPAAGMPLVHFRGAYMASERFKSSGGAYFFMWTLWALSSCGALSLVLCVRGLWRSRALGQRPEPT